MDEKNLDAELKEQAKAAQTMEELEELSRQEGEELSDDEVTGISGGGLKANARNCGRFISFPTR